MFGTIDRITDHVTMDKAQSPEQESEKDAAPESISLEKVRFRYAGLTGRPVLDDVSLEVKPGSFVALVGPSGSANQP